MTITFGGALSQTDEPDGEVVDTKTEVKETSPLEGTPTAMLREMYLKAQRPNEGLSTAYARMADALKASRGPDKSQMWFSLAAALGKPTRTGAFGETLGNAAEALGAYTGARTEAKQKGALGLAELEYKYAADQDAATQKQGLEAMKLLAKQKSGDKTSDIQIRTDPITGEQHAFRRRFDEETGAPIVEEVSIAAVATPKPSLETFMSAARKANPGVPDADLRAYYDREYGAK